MKIYRANIIHTPTPGRLEIIEHGYIVVKSNGLIEGVYKDLPSDLDWRRQVIDFGAAVPQYGSCAGLRVTAVVEYLYVP